MAACVDTLRAGGCDPVIAIVSEAAAGGEAAADEARAAGAVVAWNRETDSEQIDSLRIGLERLETMEPEADAALALPVDHPLVDAATVRSLLDAARAEPGATIRPTYDGRPGHPTLFPRTLWPRLAASLPEGARSLLHADDVPVLDVPVPDGGVTTDIDTPEVYRDALGGEP